MNAAAQPEPSASKAPAFALTSFRPRSAVLLMSPGPEIRRTALPARFTGIDIGLHNGRAWDERFAATARAVLGDLDWLDPEHPMNAVGIIPGAVRFGPSYPTADGLSYERGGGVVWPIEHRILYSPTFGPIPGSRGIWPLVRGIRRWTLPEGILR